MQIRKIAILMMVGCTTLGLSAADSLPKPDIHNPQYVLGYEAGRRDERADLCNRFEKHSTLAATLLGDARILLIRAFCASRI
jgi:hypothetical protein